MSATRKDFNPLPDVTLDKLKSEARLLASTDYGTMTIPSSTLYALVSEVVYAREEIFRLQLCESVDRILSEELDDDEEDLLAFDWLEAGGCGNDLTSGTYKRSSPNAVTDRLPVADLPPPFGLDPDDASRRLPRMD